MEYIPVKTSIMQPPKDDLFAVLDKALTDVREGDIIAVSSKVVAIHEGRCVPVAEADKSALLAAEADLAIPRAYWSSPLTISHHAFIGTAGIDESNADGHYILLPSDPFASASSLHTYLKQRFQLTNVGVIITDSHSAPLRRGATAISIGMWGFHPTINHVGEADLFGRAFKIEVSNVVDGLAAGAGVVMGETSECQPVVIIRGTPGATFSEENMKDAYFVDFKDDTFRVLYEKFI